MPTEMSQKATTRNESVEAIPENLTRTVIASNEARPCRPLRNDPPAARSGLLQLFGLDVRAAALAVIVDTLIFGSDVLSMGLMIPVGIGAAAVLGIIVYHIQRNWYRDDHASALIKAMTIGLLTAIPVPIAPLLVIPGGCLGLIQRFRRR
jgi:hypothetical protein